MADAARADVAPVAIRPLRVKLAAEQMGAFSRTMPTRCGYPRTGLPRNLGVGVSLVAR